MKEIGLEKLMHAVLLDSKRRNMSFEMVGQTPLSCAIVNPRLRSYVTQVMNGFLNFVERVDEYCW
jgi:hypothetical protein